MDIVSPAQRSRMMAGIKGKDSHPEMIVRRLLFAFGYRFRLHRRDLPGTPDIVMPGRKVVIFVHGCFWHRHQGCKFSTTPSSRTEFWTAKFAANIQRDRFAVQRLRAMGWRVLCVWECATRNAASEVYLQNDLQQWIEGESQLAEISSRTL